MNENDPNWIASREGHDWRDDELLLAVAWLKSLLPQREIDQRLEAAKEHLLQAREKMRRGIRGPLFDQSDTAAWYLFQSETFANDRKYWTEEGAMQVVPFLTRLGKELPLLLSVKGVEDRAARMMSTDRSQPDSGLYELLVALAYRRGGWDRVEFVPETRGLGRTPDLHVYRRSSRWAVECKRLRPSDYSANEKVQGNKLAEPVHALALSMSASVVVEINYKIELSDVPENYLAERLSSRLRSRSRAEWDDEIAVGFVRPVNWLLTRRVLEKDYIYFGGSRMVELLSGRYAHDMEHSVEAKWRPWPERPEFADAIYQASVVSWRSLSSEATKQKAKHFRRSLAKAESQLPSDRPGVVHMGIESHGTANIDSRVHILNSLEADLKVIE